MHGFHISPRRDIPCSILLYSEPYFSSSSLFPSISTIPNSIQFQFQIRSPITITSSRFSHFKYHRFTLNSSTENDSITSIDYNGDGYGEPDPDNDRIYGVEGEGELGGTQIEILKIGKNQRRIRSKIDVDATLQTVWDILTDYENLADFFPNLAVSQLLEKGDKFARLFQVGEQNLAFGLKFNAKGIVDCFEKDLESLPYGQKRDIEFKMIEGDFQLFHGKWSIEQCNTGTCERRDSLLNQEFHTTVSYVVDVEPKLWLPVRLVEGRLCREITTNLSSIRKEAQKANYNSLSAL